MKTENIIALFVRAPLTLWFCWEIKEETGPFTGIGFFLVFLSIECITAYMRKDNELAGMAISKFKT